MSAVCFTSIERHERRADEAPTGLVVRCVRSAHAHIGQTVRTVPKEARIMRYDNRLRRQPLTRRGPGFWRVLVCIILAVVAVRLVMEGRMLCAVVASLGAVAAVHTAEV